MALLEVMDISVRFGDASKSRLEELLAVAQTYRGWTTRELADSLDRCVRAVIIQT